MADTVLARSDEREPQGARSLILERYRRVPWWAKVLVVFAVSRVVSAVILLAYAAIEPANPWTAAHPDYFSFAGLWDGAWYHLVATNGYPATLPLTSDGHVNQNQWAFLPAYPVLVSGLSTITTLPFTMVGVFVSVAFAAGAALVFYKLLVLRLGSSTALYSVVLFCFAPLSPVLQVDYAESMQLFFIALALFYLQQRRYWTMLPWVALAAFTRPGMLAFALALAAHVVYRFVKRRSDTFRIDERVASVVATLLTLALGYAWPAIAGLVTHVPDAYTQTELSWRQPYVGWSPLVPFTPWIQGANWWIEWVHWGRPPFPFVLLAAAVIGFGYFLLSRPMRRLGVDLRLWVASYTLYLLAVFFPQSSVFRLFVPIFPVLGAIAQPRSKIYRVIVVLLFIAGQVAWVWATWWFSGSDDWTPP
jgi:hypothetical protein